MTITDTKWKVHAACVGKSSLFFSDMKKTTVKEAKAVCAVCVVRPDCLAYALKYEEYGVWGGMTANERRVHVRKLKKHGLAR